jgi:hypothetical protein
MSFDAPFAGLKVVDLSQGVAGPYTGMLLAQYGADVIKVEPHEGDWGRTISKSYAGQSAYSLPSNLGKRALGLVTTQWRRKIPASSTSPFPASGRPGRSRAGPPWTRCCRPSPA